MKRVLIMIATLALVLLLAPSARGYAGNGVAALNADIGFVPLVVLAPDDNLTPAAGPFACVDPDGNPRSTAFH